MAHSSPVVVSTIAQQLLQELDRYTRVLTQCARGDWDCAVVAAWCEQADFIYGCAVSLPRVGVRFTEFLITRAELLQAVAARHQGAASTEEVDTRLVDHRQAIESLRHAARRVPQADGAHPVRALQVRDPLGHPPH